MATDETPWVVRDVPGQTRRLVKIFAAEQNLTMAQAIERLVNIALASLADTSSAAAFSEQTDAGLDRVLEAADRVAAIEERVGPIPSPVKPRDAAKIRKKIARTHKSWR
jgi:hypothetical protein